MTATDFQRLSAGEAIVDVLPAEGRDVIMRGATRTQADADSLIRATRNIETLQQGPYVTAIKRFSTPPQPQDMAGLILDEDDLRDLRRCRPGNCGLKLSDAEINAIRRTMSERDDWQSALQEAFRNVVLARAERYLAGGHTQESAYHDQRKTISPDAEFAAIASDVALTYPELFTLTNYFSLYPVAQGGAVEAFLYWSKETLGAKPIVSITHVAMVAAGTRDHPYAIVGKKQVYASHYVTASLSFTTIGERREDDRRYLIYYNHSRSDVLDGIFAGLIRRVIHRRVRAEGPRAVDRLRQQIEQAGS